MQDARYKIQVARFLITPLPHHPVTCIILALNIHLSPSHISQMHQYLIC